MFPSGLRDRSMQSIHDQALHLRSLLNELLRARSELDYARISPDALGAAGQRANLATQRFRAAVREILNHPLPATRPGIAGDPVALLNRIRAAPDRLTAAPQAINALLRWSQESQAAADRAIYQNDVDVQNACDKLAAMTPLERTQDAIVKPQTGVLSILPDDTEHFGYSVTDDARPLPLQRDGLPVHRLLMEADAPDSDLSGGIKSAIFQTAGWPITAIIVFSDGRPIGAGAGLSSTIMKTGAPLYVICASSSAMDQTQPMRQLSQATGGSVLTLDQVSALPELLRQNPPARATQLRIELWDSLYLFALIIACLCIEWALRKSIGWA